ncbi:N-acetylglucosamine-6-phosphate deacetylase [Foetidibacter luteolus]|uniref:N-acetylglucosamine-6-phosphate deacetylase n=1 Tax=Foetidibacter luteolus TaxID=2608880 RepID=UPI00129B091D|nr:N-acetylglucosamine-6-phosphate deacetylase [Foetidibacter luteolus]
MTNRIAYTAANIFNGTDMLQRHAIVVAGSFIESVTPLVSLDETIELVDFGDAYIAPAFIDIQLYGAHGRLLSVYPDAETVTAIVDYSTSGGAAYCMPTVGTSTYEVIFKCIDAIRDYWKQGGKHVPGLHVEGPWISKAKRGAHNEEWIFSPTVAQAKELLDYGKGVIKLITLAPEVCGDDIVQLVRSHNIFVSAGHSNATYQQATAAFDKGIEMATHLYNAMSGLMHREPGMVGAIFNHPNVRASIVPDGHHVDFAAIRIAKKMLGERLFVITDAVTETTEGFYQHSFDNDKYAANGILSGSALTMGKAVKKLVEHAGISLPEALRMCSLYPARAINLSDETGLIKKGYRADMVVLDNNLNVVQIV